MIVYKLTSPSGKSYIGKTKSTLAIRFKQHVTHWKSMNGDASKYNKGPKLLYYAFDKYGPEAFTKEVICSCTDLLALNEQEIHYITLYGDYNISIGGDGRITETLEDSHKSAISEARRKWFQTEEGLAWKDHLSNKFAGNNLSKGLTPWNKGVIGTYNHSDATRMKISNATKGLQKTEEHRRKISEAKKGKPMTEGQSMAIKAAQNAKRGIPQTDKQKQAVRESRQATWRITHPDGKVETIVNLNQFCKQNGLDQSNLCRGQNRGYHAVKVTLS